MTRLNQRLPHLIPWTILAFFAVFLGLTMVMAATVVYPFESTVVVETEIRPELPTIPTTPKPSNLLFVGDIMLGRAVETLMKRHGDDYPFAKLGNFLTTPDLTVANLEGPIPVAHRQTADESLLFSFRPTSGTLLASQGIDAVSLANNHSLDQGADDDANTRTVLANAGVAPFGHQRQVDGQTVFSPAVHGRTIKVVGLHDATVRLDQAAALEAIRTAATDHDAIVIVFIHWGIEYRPTASDRQRQLAHAFIDAGADAVIGHHPHVVQDIEVYNDKFIAYSLGNFIFDQYFSVETQQGLGITVSVDDTSIAYSLQPLESVRSQPAVMVEPRRQQLLDSLAARSPEAIRPAIISATIRLARH